MKIGVLSDTHLRQANADLKRLCQVHFADVDVVLHAGDMVDLPVYEFLKSLKVEAVQGNMDEGALRGKLPVKRILELAGKKIGLIHGWGPARGLEERLRPEFEDIDCLVYGHSHRPSNHRSEGVLFFNPGTATGAGFFSRASIGFLYLDDSGIRGEIVEI